MDTGIEPRPGDDGFEGFQRRLPENCVEYMLFVLGGAGQVETTKSAPSLEAVRKEALRLADRLTGDYIWQRDPFSLEPKREKGLSYLHGTADYGDCVEDEWLIAYLLRELSRTFANLWVRVSDGDGEFLLIEAANALPGWLSPENDSNRVWIHDGRLLIIPDEHDGGDTRQSKNPPAPLALTEAVEALESRPHSLLHEPATEAEAFYRLEKYPGQIAQSLHHSPATIPRKLAHVLHARPKSIAPATEAFYLRDPAALRPLVSGSAPLVFPPHDLVTVSVRFTRVLFAQLRSQHRFDPPPAWASLLHKAEVEVEASDEARKAHARLELGAKIACGYEMLARKARESDSRRVREIALVLDDLEEDGGDSALPTDADIRAWEDVEREDNDSWLDINYDDLERELHGGNRRGNAKSATGKKEDGAEKKGDGKASFGDANAHADLRKMVSRFEAFLEDEQAGVDGAELGAMDQDDDDDEDDDSDDDAENSDDDVTFDEEQFASMMREMMGLPPDKEDEAKQKRAGGKGKQRATELITAKTGGDGGGSNQESEDEDQAVRELMSQMESELNQHGALDLDPKPKKLAALGGKGARQQENHGSASREEKDKGEESEDEEVDVDYNLAKNILESFKAQAGVAGPTGNILSMMGIRLPRDEGQDQDEPDKT